MATVHVSLRGVGKTFPALAGGPAVTAQLGRSLREESLKAIGRGAGRAASPG